MNKILFLDIDDVIAHPDQYNRKLKNTEWGLLYRFDIKSVKILNQILDETNCEIVLSSDWKRPEHNLTLLQLQEIFKWNNVNKIPIDSTVNDVTEDKNIEINEYVNRVKPTYWVAVDDLDLKVKNFVRCNKLNEGIKQSGKKQKIISYLI